MKNKKIILVVAVCIVIIGYIIGNILSNQKEPMRKRRDQSSLKIPKILTVVNQELLTVIEVTGLLYAYDKVDLFAEVSGILKPTRQRFKEGVKFKKGDLLIKIDDSVYKNNVLAQKSSLLNQLTLLLPDLSLDFPDSAQVWEKYLKKFDLQKNLSPLPVAGSDKEKYYIAARNIYNKFYLVKGMEATLDKYSLKAPFNGVVTLSSINPGTLVRPGQKLGEFTNTAWYEMETAVSVFDVNLVKEGMEVWLSFKAHQGKYRGVIDRINAVIDQDHLMVKVYIRTNHPDLKAGMFMSGEIKGNPLKSIFLIPRDILVDNDRVYIVKKSLLVLQKVSIVGERGGMVIIKGLKDGIKILGELFEGVREGKKIPAVYTAPLKSVSGESQEQRLKPGKDG